MSPIDSTPTTGQNSSSKKKNTLRTPMRALRTTTAQAARSSARQLNEDVLEVGLVHLDVAHDHALGQQGSQKIGQPLLGLVHGQLQPPVARGDAEDTGRLGQPVQPR